MTLAQLPPEQLALEETLRQILNSAVNSLGGDAGVVATWDQSDSQFTVAASQGLGAKALGILRPLLASVMPNLAENEHIGSLSNLLSDADLPSSDKAVQDSVIALPLIFEGKLLGLIYILRPRRSQAFSELDTSLLSAFARQAAVAINNAHIAHFLAQEKLRLEHVIESSADGIMTVNAHKQITGVNKALESLLGFSRDELVGRTCCDAIALTDSDGRLVCQTRCPLTPESAVSEAKVEVSGKVTTKDGDEVDVAMLYAIIRTPEGYPANAVVNVRDITRQKQAEDMRSTFLSMVGHELQTPLTIIKGYANTLARRSENSEELGAGLQVIEKESDRLSHLVNQFLLASRIESGVVELKKEPLQLAILAEKVIRRYDEVSKTHNFHLCFPEDFPDVPADPDRIEIVISNLVDNAIKYAPDGGQIHIGGEELDGNIELYVQDQGKGVPPQDAERIFERFQRGQITQTQEVRGVGLGLYICKWIMEAHGGSIRVESRVDEGSRFILSLPIKSTD